MQTNTSRSGRPSTLILFVLVLLTFIVLGNSKEDNPSAGLKCLLDDQITIQCIDELDVQYWLNSQPQYTTVMCPTLVSFMQKINQNNDSNLFSQLTKKATLICQAATSADADNGYLLLIALIAQKSYTSALRLEYQLFFHDPFQHEHKFTSTLQKCTKYLKSSTTTPYPAEQVELAIRNFYLSQYDESLKLIQAVISNLSPELSQLRDYLIFLKFRILEKNGQFPDALILVNQLIERSGQKSHWYMYHIKGNLLMHHLKFRQAISHFQQAIQVKGDLNFAFSLYNIGLCYQKMGKYAKSIEYLKKIAYPQADVLNSIGFAYYSLMTPQKGGKENKRNAQQAQNYFTKAINTDNIYYLAYYNFGVLKFDLAQYTKATQYFENSIKLNSNSSNISSKYGLFKSLYKINQANGMKFFEEKLITAEGFSPSDAGAILSQLGESKEALKYLQKAVELKSNLGEVYERKGMAQFALGLLPESMESFKKALQNGNTRSSVWFNLAYLQQQNGNYSRALYLYQKALETDPEGPAKEMIEQVKQKIEQESRKSTQSEL